jgi:DNA-cytosine methyltransferase
MVIFKKKIRNCLSLFDGISAGRLALDRAGIYYDKFYSSEIDNYAIAITQYNHPDTIQLGDVTKWREWNIDWSTIDLLIGGSPCTNLSNAGDRTGLKGQQSKLFFEYVDILNHIKKCNPDVFFLLENVKMKKEWEQIITLHLKVSPVLIDSSLLSAQSRKRLYWTNIGKIPQPKDKKIYLKDILLNESDIEEKYYINNIKEVEWVLDKERLRKKYTSIDRNKAITMTARQFASWNGTYQIIESSLEKNNKPVRVLNLGNGGQGERVYCPETKSVTLTASGGGRGAKMGLYLISHGTTIIKDDIKNYLTVPLDNISENKDEVKYYRVRKLCPIECESLQTMPKNYTKYGIFYDKEKDTYVTQEISDSRRYKSLGNSWTVDVIVWILSHIDKQNNDNNISTLW